MIVVNLLSVMVFALADSDRAEHGGDARVPKAEQQRDDGVGQLSRLRDRLLGKPIEANLASIPQPNSTGPVRPPIASRRDPAASRPATNAGTTPRRDAIEMSSARSSPIEDTSSLSLLDRLKSALADKRSKPIAAPPKQPAGQFAGKVEPSIRSQSSIATSVSQPGCPATPPIAASPARKLLTPAETMTFDLPPRSPGNSPDATPRDARSPAEVNSSKQLRDTAVGATTAHAAEWAPPVAVVQAEFVQPKRAGMHLILSDEVTAGHSANESTENESASQPSRIPDLASVRIDTSEPEFAAGSPATVHRLSSGVASVGVADRLLGRISSLSLDYKVGGALLLMSLVVLLVSATGRPRGAGQRLAPISAGSSATVHSDPRFIHAGPAARSENAIVRSASHDILGPLAVVLGLAIVAVGGAGVAHSQLTREAGLFRPGLFAVAMGQLMLLMGITALSRHRSQTARARTAAAAAGVEHGAELHSAAFTLDFAAPPFAAAPAAATMLTQAIEIAQLKAQLALLSRQLQRVLASD